MRVSLNFFYRNKINVVKKLFLYDNNHMLPVTSVKDYLCNGHKYYLVETEDNKGQKTHLVKKNEKDITSK